MAKFRSLCRTYSEAYHHKLTTRKVLPEMQVKLDMCEKIIDVLNIILIRQKIEMEVIQCFVCYLKKYTFLVKVTSEYLSKSVIFNCILMKPYS